MSVAARLKRFVKLWVDLFARHDLLDHASSIAFAVLKALVPLTLLGLAVLGAVGQRRVWQETILPRAVTRPTRHRARDRRRGREDLLDELDRADRVRLVADALVRLRLGARCDERDERRLRLRRDALVEGALPDLARPGSRDRALRDCGDPRRTGSACAGSGRGALAWVAATLIFQVLVTTLLNFKTATGQLGVFLVLTGYVYTSAIIFLVGVEVDELLREDAKEGQHGLLHMLGIARQ